MPRLVRVLSVSCLLCAWCLAADSEWTEAMNRGLHGPVRSQRITTTKLNPDPRVNPSLYILTPSPWLVFDARGRVIEESNSEDLGSISHVAYAPNIRISTGDDGTHVCRTDMQTGSKGPVDVKTFCDDKLLTHETREYDERGNMVESINYNAAGDVTAKATYGYDEKGRTSEFIAWGNDGHFNLQMLDQYDDDGDLVQRTYLDEFGRTVTIFRLSLGILINYWQAIDCGCSHGVGVSLDDVSYSYRTRPDGDLETTVETHSRTRSNIELSEEKLIVGSGEVVEKLTFSYERDAQGNWTKRVVSAWDPKSGGMIPFREDLRTLTYY